MNPIDKFQALLDARPRIRMIIRGVFALIGNLVFLVASTCLSALLGFVIGLVVIVAAYASVRPRPDITVAQVVALIWSPFTALGLLAAGMVGLLWALYRITRSDPHEMRDRDELVHDLVAQAVVAHIVGAGVSLRLGVFEGGWLSTSYPWSVAKAQAPGADPAGHAFDRLTVLLANPSLAGDGRRLWQVDVAQHEAWIEAITRTADEIVVRRAAAFAAAGITRGPSSRSELIDDAAKRAHRILSGTDNAVVESIEREFRAATTMRRARLAALLEDRAANDRASASGGERTDSTSSPVLAGATTRTGA